MSNAVREMPKCMDEAKITDYKVLLCTINYVVDMNNCCYRMKPEGKLNLPWELCGCSDVYYAVDNNTWKRMTGFVILINGVVISWCLRSQKPLHYWLQKINIQQSRSYVDKYYYPCNFIVYDSCS